MVRFGPSKTTVGYPHQWEPMDDERCPFGRCDHGLKGSSRQFLRTVRSVRERSNATNSKPGGFPVSAGTAFWQA